MKEEEKKRERERERERERKWKIFEGARTRKEKNIKNMKNFSAVLFLPNEILRFPLSSQVTWSLYISSFHSSVKIVIICSRRDFGLGRNLIRCIISPNQDDISYLIRTSFPGSRNWVSCKTHSLAEQRCPAQTSHWWFFNRSSSMDTWGNLSNLWIPCAYFLLDQWIPVEYKLDTFNTSHTGTTLCHPQNWLCRCNA